MSKSWFITGTSRGFGREWTVAALERGDRVIATARSTYSLQDLVERFPDTLPTLPLDVTDCAAAFAALARGHGHFGRLDVVVDNACYGQFGMIEELSEDELRAQIETNVFGALWVTQAALPLLRAQGGGHLLQVSSIEGISAFPIIGAHHTSTWALEGFSQAQAAEVADFGISVTLIEPGGFSTDWGGDSVKHATALPAYDGFREKAAQQRAARTSAPGNPTASARAVLGRGRGAAAPAGVLRRRAAGDRDGGLRAAPRHLARVVAGRPARPGVARGAQSAPFAYRPVADP